MANGYIKLHRSILDWEWFHDENVYRVFTYLLLNAKWEGDQWEGMELNAGQLITTYPQLSKDLGLSIRNVRTILTKLKSTGELTVKTTNKFSIITIENWAKYQGGVDESDRQTDSQTDRPPTVNRQANGVSSYYIRNKEIKNINDQNDAMIFDRFWNAYPRKVAKQAALKAFAKIKPDEALLGKMIAALERQKKSVTWLKDKGQFIPHAATWLNGRRWEDETDPDPEKKKGGEVISYLKPDGSRGEYQL
jgi:TusA-related sulfurtransferase